jgi:hypothetical protein
MKQSIDVPKLINHALVQMKERGALKTPTLSPTPREAVLRIGY